MRGKRSKQYRKLMHQYGLHFGFREPYQVLLDADILLEAEKCKMKFLHILTKTLHGQVKPMITQCSMRHLYDMNPQNKVVIEHAKNFERRRCNHHTLEKPLTALECLASVIDPKSSRTNKHRYVVASQNERVQEYTRSIPGVPLIHIYRSVVIMAPMTELTASRLEQDENSKLRFGLRDPAHEDKEDQGLIESGAETAETEGIIGLNGVGTNNAPPKKKKNGPKGPNPLSVKKRRPKALSHANTTINAKTGAAQRRRRRHGKSSANSRGASVPDE